ncbi:uncharacterized protein LOC121826335 isoform X4 [Peromyscus maniculatus bairdii]|uniref:uncharacterized protein LOC121826335 isoform X4 n=1 Tax=Peromyscus maniculatus bairdii TaxID=230844 RepID=UPI003FD06183
MLGFQLMFIHSEMPTWSVTVDIEVKRVPSAQKPGNLSWTIQEVARGKEAEDKREKIVEAAEGRAMEWGLSARDTVSALCFQLQLKGWSVFIDSDKKEQDKNIHIDLECPVLVWLNSSQLFLT